MAAHPGQILLDSFMKPLKINSNQLAKGLGVNRSTIGRLIDCRHRMSVEMAARLGAYFRVPPRWWLLMQAQYDAHMAESHIDLIDGVTPMEYNPDMILTPKGVLWLDKAESEGSPPLPSISRDGPKPNASESNPRNRKVRVIHYESGSVALVGTES